MRKATTALAFTLALALPLSGCTLSVYNSYRDIESLKVVQAIGLDLSEDGSVVLSAATGPDASGREPLRITQEGTSLDAAMRSAEELSGGGSLFFSGTGAIVLGEDAALETSRWLDALARSKQLRLDNELYVLRGDQASTFIAGDNAPEDVFADLDSLAKRISEYGPAPATICAGVSRSLLSSGAALITAIELEEGALGTLTAVPAGFAVISDGGLIGWLDDDEALGAGLFLGGPGLSVVELETVTVELSGAEVTVEPVWEGDKLSRLDIHLAVNCSVIEARPGSNFDSQESWDAIERELAGKALGWLESALERSIELEADFLGLGRQVQTSHPLKFDAMPESWEQLFPDLDYKLSGEAKILNMREYVRSPYPEVET